MQDTQAGQSAGGLFGQHGGAVVGHQGAWQAALHKGLAQGMDQTLRGLIKVPLQVAHQAGAIINHTQKHGCDPQAFAGENLTRAVVEIKVPKCVDVVELKAAYFELLQAVTGSERSGRCALRGGLTEHAMGLEVAPDRRVGGHRNAAAFELGQQVVEMQLHGPAGVLAVLRCERLNELRVQAGELPHVVALAVAQNCDRISAAAGCVVPAFQRGGAEANIQTGIRVTPRFGGKGLQ